MKKIPLHIQIMIGMLLGILFGFLMIFIKGGPQFIKDWVAPFGTIFINLLKLIAVPLILASLIKGISDLKDISKLSKIGLRTILIYVGTTIIAISIGLVLVNVIKPGGGVSQETIAKMEKAYASTSNVTTKIQEAQNQNKSGPLEFVIEMFPSNIFQAMSNNKNMLQVIVFSLFFGICLLLINPKDSKPMMNLFSSLNDVILKMVDLIMLVAPIAVFALLANVVASSEDPELLFSLLKYSMVVVIGLILMIGFYMILISLYVKKNPLWFLKQISPAQLLAFSTSSSAATLPVTMERVKEHVGVDDEVAGFVLPVGATINMDGTSLYQAVAAVFIAQALSFDLTLADQITIVLTALMASIGSAAVPAAGMVMLVMVLESIGFPSDKLAIGLALIFAVDRPLDMCRTVINVTGDATVSSIVAKSVGKLKKPKEKKLDDYYKFK